MCSPCNALWYTKPLFVAEHVVVSYLGVVISEEWPSLPASSSSLRNAQGSCWLCQRLEIISFFAMETVQQLLIWGCFFFFFFMCKPHIIILKFVSFGDFEFTFLVKIWFLAFICFVIWLFCQIVEYRSKLYLEQSLEILLLVLLDALQVF